MLESVLCDFDSKRHEGKRGRNDEANRDFGGHAQHFLMHCKANICILRQSNTTISKAKTNINLFLETFPP